MLGTERFQELRKPQLFLAAQARCGLVEHQQGRVRGESASDLQDALIAERQIACELERLFAKPDALELRERLIPGAGFLMLVQPKGTGKEAGVGAGVGPEHHIVQQAHARPQLHMLGYAQYRLSRCATARHA